MADSTSPRRTFPTLLLFCLTAGIAAAGEPPTIPIGLDAYRQWDRWPSQRIGARAYMRSTYDRRGGNEGADASHFLYQTADDFNVTLDVRGPGVLYFARYNHWHGSPWHYEVDGTDHIVRETSHGRPESPRRRTRSSCPRNCFPNPLTWTWAITKGADLMWVPMPFEKSFRMAYSRTHYGTGYYIYHQYVPGAHLSRPITVVGRPDSSGQRRAGLGRTGRDRPRPPGRLARRDPVRDARAVRRREAPLERNRRRSGRSPRRRR